MKLFFFFIATISSAILNAQNIHFIKSYGNSGYDFGEDIKQTPDTGYIATGSSSSFYNETAEAFLLKVDSLGNFEWSRNYGGSGTDGAEAVIVTNDSTYALAGHTNTFGEGGFDFYLVRTGIDGVAIWEKSYGGADWDKAHDLIQLPDSGFVLIGETYSYGAGKKDGYAVRTDKIGDTLWTRTWGGIENDVFNAVAFDGDSIVIAGYTESFGNGMKDGILIKMGIEGGFGFERIMGRDEEDFFTSIVAKDDFYMLGGTRSYNHAMACNCGKDFWMYKISDDGNTVFADTSWGGEQIGEEIIYDFVLNPNNDIFYGGTTTSWGTFDISQGKTEAFLGKSLSTFFTDGSYVKQFGSTGNDIVNGMDFCRDGGTVAVGNLNFGSSGGGNMFIARVDRVNSWPRINLWVDLDILSITLSNDKTSEISYKVYPTVTSDFVYIEGAPSDASFNLFDLNGKHIILREEYMEKISLSFLPKGMYFLEITADGNRYRKKIIKF